MRSGRILCIQPWIYDFAAYDLWVEPIGLLSIAASLREAGHEVALLDCLDRAHPDLLALQGLTAPRDHAYGCGHYYREKIPKPEVVSQVPRYYRRYGLPLDIFDAELRTFGEPDIVLVTSKMTYWYPGPQEAIRRVKRMYPEVPVIFGGTYATLCPDHARRTSGADFVIEGEGERVVLRLVGELLGGHPRTPRLTSDGIPLPAHDLVRRLRSAAILTARGCPMHCTYCASSLVSPGFRQYPPGRVLDEIAWCYALGARHFAFYDDALLVYPKRHIHPILDGVIQRGWDVDFHTPNAVHAALIDQQLADKMAEANFQTLRMGLETSASEWQRKTGGKVSNEAFIRAARALRQAGFRPKQLGAYVLVGLPGQPLKYVRETVRFVQDQGVQAKLAYYSPIPGTVEWNEGVKKGEFDPQMDPLLHNNTLLPLRSKISWQELEDLKRWTQEGNARILT